MINLFKIILACAAILVAILISLSRARCPYDLNEAAARESYRKAHEYCKTLTTYDDCIKREGWRP